MALLLRDAKRARARRKKAGGGCCGKMIEAQPLSGQTKALRGRRRCDAANDRDTAMRSGACHATRLMDVITGMVTPDPKRLAGPNHTERIVLPLMDRPRHRMTRLREVAHSGRILGMVMLDESFSAQSTCRDDGRATRFAPPDFAVSATEEIDIRAPGNAGLHARRRPLR